MEMADLRTNIVPVRFSDPERARLVERSMRSGARTPSAYIRAAALTGREFELPSWFHLRDLRNEVIKCAAVIQTAKPGPTRDKALEAAIRALERISRF